MSFQVYPEEGESPEFVNADNFSVFEGIVIFHNSDGANYNEETFVAAYSLENIYKFR